MLKGCRWQRLLLTLWLFLPAISAASDKPIVLLVSIDGYRYDYLEKFKPNNLSIFMEDGASVKGLIPSYPSLTFPNHYTMVTGLYPGQHGIIGNEFIDFATNRRFSIYTEEKRKGSWYGGEPLWHGATRQGLIAASLFWPGSDADIQGHYPTHYLPYDPKINDAQRVAQVIAWLEMPDTSRPRFISVYFSTVDHVGHKYGPDSPEMAEAVQQIDESLKPLFDYINTSSLSIHTLIVSDHGMIQIGEQKPLCLTELVTIPDDVVITQQGPYVSIHGKTADMGQMAERLAGHTEFNTYLRQDIPTEWKFAQNPNSPDLLIEMKPPYMMKVHSAIADPIVKGAHGYNPFEIPQMQGILLAKGPKIQAGARLGLVANIHVYALVTQLLGIEPATGVEACIGNLAPMLTFP